MHKQSRPFFRLAAVVLASLLITSNSEQRAHAAVSGAWTAADVGSPAIRGTAQESTCTSVTGCPVFSIGGAGVGVGGTSDQFMFVHQRLTGDGFIKLRLLSLAGPSTMEAGLMMRESLTASARHVSITTGAAPSFRRRTTAGGTTASLAVARGGWLRLERVGPSITASVSTDGTQWTVVAGETLALPSTIYVGIVVTSRSASALATAMVSNMAVTATTSTMPPGWASADVGPFASPGTASYSNLSFIGASYGAGFSAATDAFRFVYTRVRGDARLSARVVASQGRAGRQAGIVLRATLDPGAVETVLVADDAGVVLVRRAGTGQIVAKTRVATLVSPVHLKLDRVGSMVTVAYSADGVTWRTVTTVSASLGTEIYAGLAVAAGPNGGVAAAAFDRLSLVSVSANSPPVVSLTAPTNGAVVLQGRSVALTATASDPDDLVARVDFRVNGVKIASDTAAPYTASWTPSAIGLYTVTAAAADFDGALTTSAPALVTVSPSVLPLPDSGTTSGSGGTSGGTPSPSPTPTGPWRLVFKASPDHARIDRYVLNIYDTITHLLIVSRNIGKPAIAADGTCTVDVDGLVSALPGGLFDGVVLSVATSGQSGSVPYTFAK